MVDSLSIRSKLPRKVSLGNLVEMARDGDNGELVAFMRENFKLSA